MAPAEWERSTGLGIPDWIGLLRSKYYLRIFLQTLILKQRFDREARTISSLSHPHICALYDIGHQDGIDYLVMEFLEGETLAQRLNRGPLPIVQVLRFGMQIADALDKAHRQGVVHRDLKPGNVMITKSGIKLLDFGLAKLQVSVIQNIPGVSALPTEQRALTAEGTILGTLQYMSPEQLEGRETDARTDIFALGTVLYEMATGRKAFTGKSQASLIAAILSSEPAPISTIQPMSPPAFDRVVKTCLAKDPEDRWQTPHDVMLELKWIAEGGSQAGLPVTVVVRRKNRERIAWVLVSLFFIAFALAAFLYFSKPSQQAATLHVSVLSPEIGTLWHSVISPDGRTLAIVAIDTAGKSTLWMRPLAAETATRLPETEGANRPFWSPDSRYIGFFADKKLKKIQIPSGRPEVICDAPQNDGASWGQKNVIIFSHKNVLYRVPSNGGTPEAVTKLEPMQEAHRWPYFLPDGTHFLFLDDADKRDNHQLRIGSLDSQETKKIMSPFISTIQYSPGYIYFVRAGTLMAQTFDAKNMGFEGSPIPIVDNVADVGPDHHFDFSVSQNGTIVYQQMNPVSQLTWFDRSGAKMNSVGEPGRYAAMDLSPDEKWVAVEVLDQDFRDGDIWLFQTSRGTTSRFTFDPNWDLAPVWSMDGNGIAFGSSRSGETIDLYQKTLSGAEAEKLEFKSPEKKFPTCWSPDGKYLLYMIENENTGADIYSLPLFGDRRPKSLIRTPFNEGQVQLSPDGRWISYVSDESGKPEIYVQTMPPSGQKWQISNRGGSDARWRRDGKELFFISSESKLMVVQIQTNPAFDATFPKPLFVTNARFMGPMRWNYSISNDGQRFLINTLVETSTVRPVHLIFNWKGNR